MIKKVLGLLFICVSLLSQAQQVVTNDSPQMADAFRQEGKIYVVIAVIALIFLALVCFLIYIERKVKKIEDKVFKG
ncbi:CcmD family protein [Aurantibacillus circumpalustris]|uniref:CcmD family protein n=1 Tax=Aurantibacillus circumpalustris TaxID=3036359 RepID=UPI00295BF1BA|nr:CcmD family protein [Aurantibacillus circumpalustris]